jgi:RNA polymerase sigma-70 factor (ECF subfamily)
MNKENDIIKRLQKGDAEALRPLMKLHQNYVYTIAYRIVKNREKAEEVTQDVFIKVYQNINNYQARGKFTTWLYTIVFRTALNTVKKNNTINMGNEGIFEDDFYSQTVNFDTIDKFDTSKILWRAIDQLPTMQGLCISLFYLNQFNIDEIGTVLKIPSNTVKTHLHRGRKSLKSILLRQYHKEEII